ncbi:MAG TPA: hypothetical protein VKE71_07385, partial [Candidatus Angelobacter sp.]|nr:hypothetical protein [Candidatus Angelobacter sp.]
MRFRPVYLAFLLCAGMSSRCAGQQVPASQPSDPATNVPAGMSGGLNSLQGLRVAEVHIVTEVAQ